MGAFVSDEERGSVRLCAHAMCVRAWAGGYARVRLCVSQVSECVLVRACVRACVCACHSPMLSILMFGLTVYSGGVWLESSSVWETGKHS